MTKNSSDQTNSPKTGSVKIEWNWDLETSMNLGNFRPGPSGRARLKGRCKRCWGKTSRENR